MRKVAAALFFIAAATAAHAQNTPLGVWKTIDDDTKQEKSLVRISESGGVVTGKIEKLLNPTEPNPVCDKCSDDRKGKPITGMSIIDGLKQSGDVWEGGEILDPNNGKVYRVRLKPIENGKKLEVRGYIGPFFRTQTWIRVE
jgi:uncharacterized protein (DUF2147 family)